MAVIYKVPLSNNSQYTLDTQYTAGGTSLVLNTNVASVVQAPGTCVVDRVDSSGNKTASKRTHYTFTGVSTTTLTGLAVADGTDQTHAVGAIVEFVPDITWAQSIYDGLATVVDPSTKTLDTTKVVDLTTAQTLSKKTLKSSVSEVVTTAGGTTVYTLTPSVAIASYATGQEFVINMNATNTGASTINVSGLGAKSLTKGGATALSSGDLLIDAVYRIVYDGTQFQVIGLSLSSKIITATRDLTAASGSVAYTGVGFRPTSVISLGVVSTSYPFSVGLVDSSKTAQDIFQYAVNTMFTSAHLVHIATAANVEQFADVSTYDTNGFTLSWTKTGSPTGTATLAFLCLR